MPSLRTTRHRFAALRVLLACVACIGVAHAAPGDLDPSFGAAGKVITAIGATSDTVRALVVQPDGKLVVAGVCLSGGNGVFCLARYTADGSLDPAFGSGGKVITSISSNGDNTARAIALQPDGKLVAAGYCYNGSNVDFCLARYNTNGSLDASFGNNGTVVTAIGSGDDNANALTLQPDGKLVAAGTCAAGSNTSFCLARYNANGSLDTSFNGSGTVVTPAGSGYDYGYALAVQADGKLVAIGSCYNGSNYDFCLVRYNANGGLDTSFNGSGKVVTVIGSSHDNAYALAVQPDRKLVVAGACWNGSNNDFCLARYNADGSLDTGFNASGKLMTPIGNGADFAYALAVQPDGKLVAAGTCQNSGNNYDFCLARYNADGSLDASLNASGKLMAPIGADFDFAYALALQPDGKLVAAGACANGSNNANFCLARYQGGPFGYQNCKPDIDGDGRNTATVDGLIYMRVMLGLTGSAVVNDINFAANASRNTWPAIRNYLVSQCGMAIAP